MDKEANTVTIKASRRDTSRSDTVEAGWRVHSRERSSTLATRTLALPSNIKADAIKSNLVNGVLHVVLPKIEAATKPMRVPIA